MIPYKLTKTLDPLKRYSKLTEKDLSEFCQRKKEVFTFENLGGNIWELHGRYVVQYCQTSAASFHMPNSSIRASYLACSFSFTAFAASFRL